MRMITTAGAHACGKTAVILKTAEMLMKEGIRKGVMKLDCISSGDDQLYRACGIPNIKYISGNICPDHYFADSVPEIFEWGRSQNLDLLITESAGLCGRCAPHIREVPAVCVIDCLSGVTAPKKAGPMLRCADFIAVTKGDLVSPAEREVFLHNIRQANKKARVTFLNGLTGQGAYRLAAFIKEGPDFSSIEGKFLRFTMPSAVCSFCAGQMQLSQKGNGGRMKRMWKEAKDGDSTGTL